MKKIILSLLLLFPIICWGATDVDVIALQKSHKTTIVTVGTSATALPTTALSGRRTIMIENLEDKTVYLGNSAVTADTTATGGFQLLKAGDTWTGDFNENIVVYGRVASSTALVCVWEVR